MNVEFIKLFNQIKKSKEEVIFRNAFKDIVTFEEFKDFRDKSNLIRETRWEDDFKLSINFESDGSPIMEKNKAFNYFRSNLYEVWGDDLWDEPAFLMTEYVGDGSGLRPHSDPCEQIHWNCVGHALWTVYRFDGTEVKHVLNPGDVIFLPDGMKHGVVSLSAPRAGIAYSIDQKNFRKDQKRGRYADL
jgi:hypothetical protein